MDLQLLTRMIQATIKKAIAVDYPHLKLPAIVYARVDSVRKLDTYEIRDLVIYNDDTGGSFHAHIVAYWYEYKLTVLDRFGSPDKAFPALPQIKTRKQFKQGASVAVALTYGELAPDIIGEVRL